MIYLTTQRGKGKAASEDHVLVGEELFRETSAAVPFPENGYICVADGVGGSKGGGVASETALRALAALDLPVKDAVRAANAELLRVSAENAALSVMATTLTGVRLAKGAAELLHVGNTRAYVRQGRYLKRITSDHTTYNLLRSMGRAEEAEKCNRSEIVSCLGGGDARLAERLQVETLPVFNLLALTSDGVHEYVDIDTMEDVLSGDMPWEEKCETLVRMAREAGSEDDATVVLAVQENGGRL